MRGPARASERGRAGLVIWRALPLAFGLCLGPAAAFGAPAVAPAGEPSAAGRELQLGARDEAAGAFARALEHYRASADAAPSSRAARTARARITWIEERSEGGFAPLALLAAVRRDPATLGDPPGLARLCAEVEALPAGRVRSELRLRAAEAWQKLGRREDAALEQRRIVSDPSSAEPDRVFAERDLVRGLLAAGRLDAARDEVAAHPFDPLVSAEVAARVHRRRLERWGAAGLLALLVLAAARVRSIL